MLGEEYSEEISENLAACYLSAKNYDEAINILEKSYSKQSYQATQFYLRGMAHQGKEDTLDAVKFLEKSIQSDSSFTPWVFITSSDKKEQGNLPQAIFLSQ